MMCNKYNKSGVLLAERKERALPDRRSRPTPIISRYTFYGGRRKIIRREEDRQRHIYVDLYSTRLLVIVMAIILLSCLDAYLTLALIGKGKAIEANPIMAFFLEYGAIPFAIVKFTITAISLIILCLFKNVRITRICLPCAVKIYVAVIMYEVYLFMI